MDYGRALMGLSGKLLGDKGYISQVLFETLLDQNLRLITKIKKNMKNKLMPIMDKVMLRKRAVIETVNDQLKNISHIEHTRHRSLKNFTVSLFPCRIFPKYAISPLIAVMHCK